MVWRWRCANANTYGEIVLTLGPECTVLVRPGYALVVYETPVPTLPFVTKKLL